MQILIDIGMTLLMIAVIPQIWKTWRNRKQLKDIDFKFSALTMLGNIFAIIWGLLYAQWSIALLNLLYLIWTVLSLASLLKYKR